ncbi:trichothecene efflux pump [Fusarium beomiforme]|uniref:Trichothecene efflux pump n=1 Tax=Fusarium beomiforme TaxID=44412 RepID=A0A9P5A928_9HYPO|nr:trichothecene efflux pump [Fusarium beomiforme]
MGEQHEIAPLDTPEMSSLSQDKKDALRSEALAADLSTLPEGYYLSWQFMGTFTGISLVLAATYWALQAVAGCLVQINQELGPSDNYYLVTIIWTIGQAVSILLFGRFSDMFGRRNLALGANALGLVGGIVGATAQSMNQMIAAFSLLGLAAGVPGSYPLLTGELLTHRLKYLGTIIVVVPNVIATGFGPYLGIRLALFSGWRWIFYIYIILMANRSLAPVAGTIALWFFYYPPSFTQLHGKSTSILHELSKVDWVGTLLLVAGLTLFLLGISWGGPYPWNSARVLGLLVSGGVILILFVLFETFGGARKPIVPVHHFRDIRGFTCVVIISAITGCLQTALFILWPSQVLYIFGSTSSGWQQTAWMSSVVNFASWSGIIIIGPLFHIIKHLRFQLMVGSAWMTAFLGAMSAITYTKMNSAIAFSFLASFPMGWGEIFTMLMVQYIVSDQDLGVAFAIVCGSRLVLGSIFSSIFVAIYTNKLPVKLAELVVPAVQKAGLPASSLPGLLKAVTTGDQTIIQAVPGMNATILTATNRSAADAYGQSYAYVYYTAVALGVVCFIASVCLRDFDHYLTDHVSRQLFSKEAAAEDALTYHVEKLPDSNVEQNSHARSDN